MKIKNSKRQREQGVGEEKEKNQLLRMRGQNLFKSTTGFNISLLLLLHSFTQRRRKEEKSQVSQRKGILFLFCCTSLVILFFTRILFFSTPGIQLPSNAIHFWIDSWTDFFSYSSLSMPTSYSSYSLFPSPPPALKIKQQYQRPEKNIHTWNTRHWRSGSESRSFFIFPSTSVSGWQSKSVYRLL